MMECKPVFLGLVVVVLCLHYSQAVSPVSPPLSDCPRVACRCPFGTIWTTDVNGCRTCSCNPEPVECPLFKCSPCPRGLYKKDENGCQTCTCEILNPLPVCPAIGCVPGRCKYGYELDANGCNRCRCKQCPAISCPERDTPCPNGYAEDSNGCPSCNCKPSACEPVICPLVHECPFGFAKDFNGCQIGCECAPGPLICPQIECAPLTRCPDGFETNSNGCPSCRCKTKCPTTACPAVICPDGLGFEYDTDENGCRTNCRCRTRSPVCPKFLCRFYCRIPQRLRSRSRLACSCTCPDQTNA